MLLGYYFLRRWRPEVHRPYRLPEWMKYVAMALAALYFDRLGGRDPRRARSRDASWAAARCSSSASIVVLLYFPLNWWRKAEDRKLGTTDYRPTSVS